MKKPKQLTALFWKRQAARYRIWRATGHHFLWNTGESPFARACARLRGAK